ncbi:hypothetical protein NX059_002845 [Plenodomus lindquistii]|nr:hypothetical protein NX059_002845 [Plenodomus lindquistii]
MKMKMNTTALIVFPIIAVIVLVLLFIFRPTNCCCFPRKESILPVAHHREPRPTFSERHIAHLRNWRKPPVSSGGLLPLYLGQTPIQDPAPLQPIGAPPQGAHCLGTADLQTPALPPPTLTRPENSHQPQRPSNMTWQQFQDRRRPHDPVAEAERRRVIKEWQPVKPRNAEFWKQYGEEMEARKSIWEKLQDKWFKRFPRKERVIECY